MTYELFKQSSTARNTNNDPMKETMTASEVATSAIGLADLTTAGLGYDGADHDVIPVAVQLAFRQDRDHGAQYVVEVHVHNGNENTYYYTSRFVAEAVFEKLVREYDLRTEFDDADAYEVLVDEWENGFVNDGEQDGADEDDDNKPFFSKFS